MSIFRTSNTELAQNPTRLSTARRISPDVRAKMESIGFPVMTSTAEEFEALIKSQIELVAKIAKAAKIPAKEQ